MKKLATILMIAVLVVTGSGFINGQPTKEVEAQGCAYEMTPYGCGEYTHTQILVRAQPDGKWVIHENGSHPQTNISAFIQHDRHLEVQFTETNTQVLHVSAQASNVAGYRGLDVGISGGLSGISSYLGMKENLIKPSLVRDRNWLIWYYVLGFIER